MLIWVFLSAPLLPLATSRGSAPFDYLMFTQIYPFAVCRADDDTVPDSCEIPDGAPQWTIHGLWPNFNNGSYPQFCDSRKFDEKQIQDLREKMVLQWPNLYPEKTPESFWKHEWEKHGTCAGFDPTLQGQHNYFGASLSLRFHLDIWSSLSSQGVIPRSSVISSRLVTTSLQSTLGGVVQLHCVRDKKTKQWLLGDVRVCINLAFHVIDCPPDGAVDSIGDSPPLPGFQPCPSEFYYLDDGIEPKSTNSILSFRVSPIFFTSPLLVLPFTVFLILFLAREYFTVTFYHFLGYE